MNKKIILFILIFILGLVSVNAFNYSFTSNYNISCFQEDAVISNQTGFDGNSYGNCGLNYSGSYNFININFQQSLSHDGNYSSYTGNDFAGISSNSTADYYVNYSKPFNTLNSSIFHWQFYNIILADYILPSSCYSLNFLSIRFRDVGFNFNRNAELSCFNGSSYINFTNNITLPVTYTDYVFEESITWNVNSSNNKFINYSFLSLPSSGVLGEFSVLSLNLSRGFNQSYSNIKLVYNGVVYSSPIETDFSDYSVFSQSVFNNVTGNFSYFWNVSLNDFGNQFNFSTVNNSNLVYPLNLSVNVFDESTGFSLSGINISVLLQNLLTNQQYSLNNNLSVFNFSNLSSGSYSLQLIPNSSSYGIRTYFLVINSSTSPIFNAYLSGSSSVTLTYIDVSSGNALEGVQVTMYRVINSSSTIVANHNTDVTGRVQFSYSPNVLYNFVSSLSGYDNKNYVLNPILFSSYNVFLKKVSSFPVQLSDVNFNILPSNFVCGENNTFVFQVSSGSNSLASYFYNLSYFNGSNSFSGSNPSGGADVQLVNIVCDGIVNTVVLDYGFTNVYGNSSSYEKTWVVGLGGVTSEIASNYTIQQNVLHRNNNNLGILEKVLVSTLITFFALGVGSYLGGGVVGLLLGSVSTIICMFMFPLLAFAYSIVLLACFLLYFVIVKIGGFR